MYIFPLQFGTICARCRCVILPHESYVGINMDGCVIFVHVESP